MKLVNSIPACVFYYIYIYYIDTVICKCSIKPTTNTCIYFVVVSFKIARKYIKYTKYCRNVFSVY